MIIFERLGGWGLGNSMFQIATTIAIAKENNVPFYFPDNSNLKNKLNTVLKNKLSFIDLNSLDKTRITRWGHGDFRYLKAPIFDNDNIIIIDGFFQCEKNFNNIRDIIKDTFEINDEYKTYLKNKYEHILSDNSCSLHVRRGDYLTTKEMNVLTVDYYKTAITHFSPETLFVIFSDDIKWCKQHLDFISNKVFIEENNDILELTLMSYFKNNIIANSTFSWWGAWLGEHNKVIAPNPNNSWFSVYYYKQEYNCRINDYNSLVCKNWIII